MQQKEIMQALVQMREKTKPRKFIQSIELIINFKDLDTKKPENQVDVKVNLPHTTGKVGSGKSLLFAKNKDFIESTKGMFDRIIEEAEIEKLGKKDIAAIIAEYDVLLAEAPVMIAVGKYLGQQLAPKGKMPKPVQPSKAMVEQTLKQLGSVTRITNKKGKFMPLVQTVVGNEKMEDAQLGENAMAIFEAVAKALPRKHQNIKSIYVKESMGPTVKIGADPKAGETK